ncbi:MAG: hypothetical protein V3V99_09645 [candidate division Zixibacteria bacterium]
MKKYIIAIILVLVLVSIAYIKVIYSSQEKQRINYTAPDENYISKDDVLSMTDSLRQYLIDSIYADISDSPETISDNSGADEQIALLNHTIDSLENSFNDLNAKLDISSNELQNVKNDYSDLKLNLADKYYKGELANLPADLSDYEKTVSIKEIKNKIKKYFDLTTKQLNGIAIKYN